MAYRKWDMGNDTVSYIHIWEHISETSYSLREYLANTSIEPGYVIYNWILLKISDNPRFLFIVTSAFVNYSIGRFVYKHVDCPGIFICFFIGFTQLDFFLSAMRHSIAIAILLFAFSSLIEKKNFRSILFFLIATSFHNAIWIFAIVYFFTKSSEKDKQSKNSFMIYYALFVVVFVCLFFFDNILGLLLNWFPKYSYYNNSKMFDGEPRLAIVLKIIVYSIIFVVSKLFCEKNNKTITLHSEGEKLSVINIALYIISNKATALTRLSSNFILFATMHYSNCVAKTDKKRKIILTIISVFCIFMYGLVIIVLKTPDWQTTYPISIGISLQ